MQCYMTCGCTCICIQYVYSVRVHVHTVCSVLGYMYTCICTCTCTCTCVWKQAVNSPQTLYRYQTVTRCVGCAVANTRPHQLRWGDWECGYYTSYACTCTYMYLQPTTPVLKAGHPAPPQFSRLGTQGPAFLFFCFVCCVFCVLCVLEVLSILLSNVSVARMLCTCFSMS